MLPKTKGLKRKNTKYPGLTPSVHPRNRQEYIDYDYVHQLSAKEKEWLSNFTEEYLGGNFQHAGTKMHKSKKERKTCYDRTNARNRDMYSKAVATKRLMSIDDVTDMYEDRSTNEDILIKKLDDSTNE